MCRTRDIITLTLRMFINALYHKNNKLHQERGWRHAGYYCHCCEAPSSILPLRRSSRADSVRGTCLQPQPARCCTNPCTQHWQGPKQATLNSPICETAFSLLCAIMRTLYSLHYGVASRRWCTEATVLHYKAAASRYERTGMRRVLWYNSHRPHRYQYHTSPLHKWKNANERSTGSTAPRWPPEDFDCRMPTVADVATCISPFVPHPT